MYCSLQERSLVEEMLVWLVMWKETPIFTHIFISTMVFVAHIQNDDLNLDILG